MDDLIVAVMVGLSLLPFAVMGVTLLSLFLIEPWLRWIFEDSDIEIVFKINSVGILMFLEGPQSLFGKQSWGDAIKYSFDSYGDRDDVVPVSWVTATLTGAALFGLAGWAHESGGTLVLGYIIKAALFGLFLVVASYAMRLVVRMGKAVKKLAAVAHKHKEDVPKANIKLPSFWGDE